MSGQSSGTFFPLLAALSDLEFNLPRLPAEIRQKIAAAIHDPSDLISIETQRSSSGDPLTVHIKPSDWLLDFQSACRTGNFEKLFVEREPGCQDEDLRIAVKILMVRKGLDKNGFYPILANRLSIRTGRRISQSTLSMALSGYRTGEAYHRMLQDLHDMLWDGGAVSDLLERESIHA